MEAILSRRSIRKYRPEAVQDEVITGLLRAAMSAPSAGNEQPWQFVVLRKRSVMDRVPDFHPYSAMIREAPVAILVCGTPLTTKYDGQYWVQDCAAATQNILVAARAKGLGTVWLGVYPINERIEGLRALLGIPADVVPFALVPVGYPAEEKQAVDRYDPKRVHFDQW